jgi:hypothetical protein
LLGFPICHCKNNTSNSWSIFSWLSIKLV